MLELTYNVVNIANHVCHLILFDSGINVTLIFNWRTVTFMHILIMTFIVIDRFLEIYLNIKYPIICSTKKTKHVLLMGLTIREKVFKNGASEICGRLPFKNMK